jgi:hypothetical protein
MSRLILLDMWVSIVCKFSLILNPVSLSFPKSSLNMYCFDTNEKEAASTYVKICLCLAFAIRRVSDNFSLMYTVGLYTHTWLVETRPKGSMFHQAYDIRVMNMARGEMGLPVY